MIYVWILLPVVIGLVYLIRSEKNPSLDEKLVPIMKFFGYVLGIGAAAVLLWGMFHV